jgi:hypothetical protein
VGVVRKIALEKRIAAGMWMGNAALRSYQKTGSTIPYHVRTTPPQFDPTERLLTMLFAVFVIGGGGWWAAVQAGWLR